MSQDGRVLTVIVCGAGPASEVGQLVKLAQKHGWTVQVVATPAALDFLDVPAIEALTGGPVRSEYRKPGEPRSRPADAIIVAPATYNTINKWAQGISDTYALGILAETTALGVPIVVLPFVNSALAARAPFRAVSRICAAKASIFSSAPAVSNPTNRAPAVTLLPATPGTWLSPRPNALPIHTTGSANLRPCALVRSAIAL